MPKGRLKVTINTNNGVKRQNESFKQKYQNFEKVSKFFIDRNAYHFN